MSSVFFLRITDDDDIKFITYQQQVEEITKLWYNDIVDLTGGNLHNKVGYILPISAGYFLNINPYHFNHFSNIRIADINEYNTSTVSKERVDNFRKNSKNWKEYMEDMENGETEKYLDILVTISNIVPVHKKKNNKKTYGTDYTLEERIDYYKKFMRDHLVKSENKLYGKEIAEYCREHGTRPYGGKGFTMEQICENVHTEDCHDGINRKFIYGKFKEKK
jgi:hypothetical protein